MSKQASISTFFTTKSSAPSLKRAREEDVGGGAAGAPSAGAPPGDAAAWLIALGLPASHGISPLLLAEAAKPYFASLRAHVASARRARTVYPPPGRELAALALLPDLRRVRVVIIGQDPYHGAGQAHGLAFSVPVGVALPPSLRNILKEVAACCGSDGGGEKPLHGNLEGWARQGVLLINTVLTVDAGAAFSHAGRGWERLTDAVIAEVARLAEGAVFMLWGKPAQEKRRLIQPAGKHLVLEAPHPSPLSAHRGFLGCAHFAKANAWLEGKGREPVRWWPL